jgi:Fe-S oxidoreductase
VRLPLDQAGAEVLLVTPSADFFAEPHVDGLLGYAKVFHQAGISWTLSTTAAEAANFGLFTGSEENMRRIALRVREAALALGVRRIVFGECGHAWRVARNMLVDLAGSFDFLDGRYPVPQHIVEVTHDLWRRGAIAFDPDANDGRRVTFHDSCNVARASSMGGIPGGQFTLPRELLGAACNHVFEMRRDTTREATFCCGGGGGLLTDELMELRVAGARPRMDALAEQVDASGVTHLVAMCAICKSQFAAVLPRYGLEFDQVLSLHQVVGDALVMGR